MKRSNNSRGLAAIDIRQIIGQPLVLRVSLGIIVIIHVSKRSTISHSCILLSRLCLVVINTLSRRALRTVLGVGLCIYEDEVS